MTMHTGNACKHTFTRKVRTADYKMITCNSCNELLDYVVTGKRFLEILSPERRKEWLLLMDEKERLAQEAVTLNKRFGALRSLFK